MSGNEIANGKVRITSIDALKVIAAFCVIQAHSMGTLSSWMPRSIPTGTCLLLMGLLTRFAVPFFFMASGYFFSQALEHSRNSPAVLRKFLGHLTWLFILWTLVYAVLPNDFLWNTVRQGPAEGLLRGGVERLAAVEKQFNADPVQIFLQGSLGHLWFFPSLMMALFIVYMLRNSGGRVILAAGGVLYLLALLAGPYVGLNPGFVLPVVQHHRDGPFFSTLFVAIGFVQARQVPFRSFRLAAILAMTGYILTFMEITFLNNRPMLPGAQDFVLGTIPFAFGVFLMGLSRPDWGKGTVLALLAPATLGIYLLHPLVWQMIWLPSLKILGKDGMLMGFSLILFPATAMIALGMQRLPVLRRLVS